MPTFNTDQREKKIDYLQNFALFLESAERRPVTIKNYLCDLKYFEKWFEQKTEQKLTPERITPTDLRDYKHFLSEVLSLKPKTVNRKLSSLKSFLNWACSEELIPEHRTPRIPKPIKEEKVGPQWLERNEQHNLVRMVEQGQNQRDITIIQLLLNTGLRVSELCGLMWSDIKITSRKGRLTVRSGKGGKRREIPLNKDARKVLKDLGYSNQKGKFEAIFMGQRGPMTPRGVESMFRKYVAHTELDEVTPHKLRHTFCKNLIDAGVSLEKVAMLAGHENLETTRLYCSPSDHDLEAAVELIGVEGS
ncbi:MAG: tyrosine-type recombinase/integrase [Xenococcus sp. (in: cyanobacteria)]